MERFVKLAEGNPLVLQILAKDLLSKEASIKHYYKDLPGGATVTFDDESLENEEGAKNAIELRSIAYDLLIPSDEILSRRWLDTSIRIARGEALSMRSYCQAIPLTFFGLTWGAIPIQDLWWYVCFLGFEVSKEAHDGGILHLANRDRVDDIL